MLVILYLSSKYNIYVYGFLYTTKMFTNSKVGYVRFYVIYIY